MRRRFWLVPLAGVGAALSVASMSWGCTTITGSVSYHSGSATSGPAGTTITVDGSGLSSYPKRLMESNGWYCMNDNSAHYVDLALGTTWTPSGGTITGATGDTSQATGYTSAGNRQICLSDGGDTGNPVIFRVT